MPTLLVLLTPVGAHMNNNKRSLAMPWSLFLVLFAVIDSGDLSQYSVTTGKRSIQKWKRFPMQRQEVKIWSTSKIELCQTGSWAPATRGLTMNSQVTCTNSHKYIGIFMIWKVLKARYYLTVNVTVHLVVFSITADGGEEFKALLALVSFNDRCPRSPLVQLKENLTDVT